MRRSQFTKYYRKYHSVIKAIARKLAKQDNELAEDLEQEAAVALLDLDLTRATSNEDAFIRTVCRNSMVDYLRKNKPNKYISLDWRLACGDQVEQLPNGDLYLITGQDAPPRLHDDDVADDEEEGEAHGAARLR